MDKSQKFLLNTVLCRIDINIESINTKANLAIGFNTFVIGSIIIGFQEIIGQNTPLPLKVIISLFSVIILAGTFMSIYKAFQAISPNLKTGNIISQDRDKYHTLLFFGSIKELPLDAYRERIINLTPEALLEDMTRQIHLLSQILTRKYELISQSIFWLKYCIFVPTIVIAILKIIVILIPLDQPSF